MKLRMIVLALTGAILLTAGSMVWRSRLAYSPEASIQIALGTRLVEIPIGTDSNLTDACRVVNDDNGWILFILNASITNDDKNRTFFETAEEPLGLYVEYEPGLFRLGLGMGPGNTNAAGELISSMELPIRRVHRREDAQVFIGVTRDVTRVVTNTRDARIAWPGYLADEWKCNAVRITDDTRESTHGYTCSGCDVRLRYATGSKPSELDEVLDSVSNMRQFNVRRWSGTALTFLGVAVVAYLIGDVSQRRRSLRRLDSRNLNSDS